MKLAINRCAVGQLCSCAAIRLHFAVTKPRRSVRQATSQRREMSAMLTIYSPVRTLTDVSVNTSFSDTRSKAAKIIKRSNEFRNRNRLRKVQQCCQHKVVEACQWYERERDTWLKEIGRGNKVWEGGVALHIILSGKEISKHDTYSEVTNWTVLPASCLRSYSFISYRHTWLSAKWRKRRHVAISKMKKTRTRGHQQNEENEDTWLTAKWRKRITCLRKMS
jgi:hypothetical protein